MTVALREIESLWTRISPIEKAQALQWMIQDLGNYSFGIDQTEGICGGSARIARTRIPVWLLVRQKQLGFTDIELLEDYPHLRSEDLFNAWNYYQSHKTEIDNLITDNEED